MSKKKKNTTWRKGGTSQETGQKLVSTTKYSAFDIPSQATRRPARANQPIPLPQNDKPIERVEFCCNGCAGRAKKLLKQYSVKIELVACSEHCKFFHVGIVLNNPHNLDIEFLLLRGGFVHLSDDRTKRRDNGAFEIEYRS